MVFKKIAEIIVSARSEYQIETQTFVPSDASFIRMRDHG